MILDNLILWRNRFLRLPDTVRKRLFWRRHLAQAQADLRNFVRELPTTEMMLSIPLVFRGEGFYKSLELRQNMLELLGLVQRLKTIPLNLICEIGTFRSIDQISFSNAATMRAGSEAVRITSVIEYHGAELWE